MKEIEVGEKCISFEKRKPTAAPRNCRKRLVVGGQHSAQLTQYINRIPLLADSLGLLIKRNFFSLHRSRVSDRYIPAWP